MLRMYGKGKSFVKALATGRFPKEEVEKFVKGDPSLVDNFVLDPAQTLETLDSDNEKTLRTGRLPRPHRWKLSMNRERGRTELPVVETKDVLASLNLQVVRSADEEAVEFLIDSGVAKLWKHAYRDEAEAVAQAKAFSAEGYAEQVRSRFLDEYRQAKDLAIPHGYAFQVNGRPAPPNLMQRHFAVRVREQKRVGNWSGTGAGKTLAAVLASRVVGSRFTVVCCPNSVVEGWCEKIREVFPDSIVAAKTFAPDWAATDPESHRYLVLNYEAFQQPDSAQRVRALVEREAIDFIVVDEIHYAKRRGENISQRRAVGASAHLPRRRTQPGPARPRHVGHAGHQQPARRTEHGRTRDRRGPRGTRRPPDRAELHGPPSTARHARHSLDA